MWDNIYEGGFRRVVDKTRNIGWTVQEIKKLIQQEHPEWSGEIIKSKAKEVYNALKSLDRSLKNNNDKYYRNNIALFEEHMVHPKNKPKKNSYNIDMEIERDFDNYYYVLDDLDL